MRLQVSLAHGLRALVGIALFLLCQLVAGCLPPLPPAIVAPTQTVETALDRIQRGFMTQSDLPLLWTTGNSGVPNKTHGGVARYVTYHPQREVRPYIGVDQEITLYPDGAASQAAYKIIQAETIPPDYADQWPRPPELVFTARADESIVGCLPLRINDTDVLICEMVARYGDLVTRVGGNIVDRGGITLPQFRYLLESVDAKMAAIREPHGSGISTPAP